MPPQGMAVGVAWLFSAPYDNLRLEKWDCKRWPANLLVAAAMPFRWMDRARSVQDAVSAANRITGPGVGRESDACARTAIDAVRLRLTASYVRTWSFVVAQAPAGVRRMR